MKQIANFRNITTVLVISICFSVFRAKAEDGPIGFDGLGVLMTYNYWVPGSIKAENGSPSLKLHDPALTMKDGKCNHFSLEGYLGVSWLYFMITEFGYSWDLYKPKINPMYRTFSGAVNNSTDSFYYSPTHTISRLSYNNLFCRFVLNVPGLGKVFRPYYGAHFGTIKGTTLEKKYDVEDDKKFREWKYSWSTGAILFPNFIVSLRADYKNLKFTYKPPQYSLPPLKLKSSVFSFAILLNRTNTKD